MGPLWAWVILWLISAYGLVRLLRAAMARTAVENVPVLVATPGPIEPASAEPNDRLDPPAEAPPTEEAAEEDPVLDSHVSDASEEVPGTGEPSVLDVEEPLAAMPPLEEAPEPEAVALSPDPDEPPMEIPGGEEPEAAIASEPWVKEKEVREADEPWVKEKEVRAADELWVKEKEVPVAEAPGGQAEDEEIAVEGLDPSDEEPVEYRSIALDSLTLGLEATEIQELYGSPGHMSKVGADGEQWRYPLNATDDRGAEVGGVLVLEFQRGRLVSKALEQAEARNDA